jgi:hypothetical protein
MTIPYRFVPWARRGLARAHQNVDAVGAVLEVRPRITVGLTLQAKQDGTVGAAVSGNVDLTLYGPADVIGIDPKLVVRTDPKPNATNFEPNYLAIVDFDPPDFPWMFTPARADASGRLRPWLVLIVLERSKVALPVVKAGRPLPSISLDADTAASELPNLDESWLWAHAQAVADTIDPAALSSDMNAAPERNISRLVCPRRLEPRKDYIACVVPATDGGRLRGLGQPIVGDTLQGAWTAAHNTPIDLPVYHHWEFSTGPLGDIEALARRIRTPSQYAGQTDLIAQLEHIGQRPVAVDADRLLVAPGVDGPAPLGRTVFEGAMMSLNFRPDPADMTQAGKLAAILDSGPRMATDGTVPDGSQPTLSPPIYGEFPARRHAVDTTLIARNWLDELNLQPRYRLAAGWGAEIVRQNQDEFMQSAWEQLGHVLAVERAFSLARLSHDVLKRVEARHLAKLSSDRLLAVMGPARARVKLGNTESLYGRMQNATLPQELFDGSMRRLTSLRAPVFRKAQWRGRAVVRPNVAVQMMALVADFADASKDVTAIDPNRFVPDGLVGSVSYDTVPLPGDLGAMVNLKPYLGLDVAISGTDLQAIQASNAAARTQVAAAKRKVPAMGDVWHKGLLTDTHAQRVSELQRVAQQSIGAEVSTLIRSSSSAGTEGVLLAVQSGKVSSQSLRIDARSGALKAYGSALTVGVAGRAVRVTSKALKITGGLVASLPVSALKLYGNTAVFTSLPPSSLGQGAATVSIGLGSAGDFSKITGGATATVVPTITLPPAIKDHATLHRYSVAYKVYQEMVVPPISSEVQVVPVDFAIETAVTQTRARSDPTRTVPARLASMLSLGGQEVTSVNGILTHPYIASRLNLALDQRLRYIIPLLFDRVMTYPNLLMPLSKKLEALAPDVFLPGVGALPEDFIMAVQTNPRFVEALMVGANHEMGREMLWQGMPTDQRGTPFQRFWQRLDYPGAKLDDIQPLHQWNAVPLGTQPGSAPLTVLLIRGQLLERFPTVSIYAYPIAGTELRPGGSNPPPAAGVVDASEMDPSKIEMPILRGHLGSDISYIGFNIDPKTIDTFFFVVQEQMTEPRFGFDDPDGKNQVGRGWQAVDWNDVQIAGGAFLTGPALQGAARQAALPADLPRWNTPHAATVAQAMLQQPFRGYWSGSFLKTP